MPNPFGPRKDSVTTERFELSSRDSETRGLPLAEVVIMNTQSLGEIDCLNNPLEN